ncbi:MAG TPA: hypothetical protein VGL23_20345 [Chloroflexota bacterium]|jgi:hypothetical protein
MAVPSDWLVHDAGLVLDPARAAGVRRRLALWHRDRGGRFSGDGPDTAIIWSGGRAVPNAEPIAAFTMRECGRQVIVERLYWRPDHARVELVWRALGLLVGRPPEPARRDRPAGA